MPWRLGTEMSCSKGMLRMRGAVCVPCAEEGERVCAENDLFGVCEDGCAVLKRVEGVGTCGEVLTR